MLKVGLASEARSTKACAKAEERERNALRSVQRRMVDLEMIELPRGTIALKLTWVSVASRPLQKGLQGMVMFGTHLLLNAIRTEALDRTSHKKLSFID